MININIPVYDIYIFNLLIKYFRKEMKTILSKSRLLKNKIFIKRNEYF